MAQAVLHALLLASSAVAVILNGTPEMNQLMQTKAKADWGCGGCQNVPDGKFLSFRADPNDKSKGFIINSTPNYFMTASTSQLDDSIELRDISSAKGQNDDKEDGSNYVILDNDTPIPDASQTGLRGNGTLYDQLSVWIFGAFRLSETSQPDADPNAMIGFEHNEDYWGESDCTYKSIGVRYSKDLGMSWTRSVPIITAGTQAEQCDVSKKFTGSGDFAPAWNHKKKEWNIFSPESKGLGLKVSNDPLATPGTWSRLEPESGKTQPGWIGSDNEDDDVSIPNLQEHSGANPSIIFDEKNDVFHMVWSKWGDGIAYSKSPDLYTWDKSQFLIPPGNDQWPSSKYPSLIGDEGDTLTTDGTAMLYFGADNQVDAGRALWAVKVDFGNSGASDNNNTDGATAPNSNTAGESNTATDESGSGELGSGNTSGNDGASGSSTVTPATTEKDTSEGTQAADGDSSDTDGEGIVQQSNTERRSRIYRGRNLN